jgi:sugar phosphate isomerase/epimerase
MDRRNFLKLTGAALLAARVPRLAAADLSRLKIGAISDEISGDFETALRFLQSYGLHYVEIRSLWKQPLFKADDGSIKKAIELLKRYQISVPVVDTPFMKCTLPGTKLTEIEPGDFNSSEHPYAQDAEVLEAGIARARQLGAGLIRVFTFWRTTEPERMIEPAAAHLDKAAARAAKYKISLAVENEFSCNVCTGDEIRALFKRVRARNVFLTWDPANLAHMKLAPFPEEYRKIPKGRIRHMHLKDAMVDAKGVVHWVAIGQGSIDWAGMLRAMRKDGYQGMFSLETHYSLPRTATIPPGSSRSQEASRISMEGMLDIFKRL